MKRIISLALCFLLIFSLCPPVFAAEDTITWTGAAGDGLWHTAENWDLGRVPQEYDHVIIPCSSVVEYVYGEITVELYCEGDLTVSSGTLKLEGNSTLYGTLDGAGDIIITDGGELSWWGGSIQGSGNLVIEDGGYLDVDTSTSSPLDRFLVNNGSLEISCKYVRLAGGAEGGGNFNVYEGETLELGGSGTYNLSGNVNNFGTLKILNTCSSAQFNSGYTQQNTGTLEFNIGGPSDFTKLEVTGNAILNGELKINILDGYGPQPGDTFEIMTYSSRAGTFSSIVSNMPEITFEPAYNDNSLILTVKQDIDPPELIGMTPAHGTTDVQPDIDELTLEFDEPVWGVWGKYVTIYEAETDAQVRQLKLIEIDIWPVSGNGTDTITVGVASGTFQMGVSYYIIIDQGGFVDGAGNEFLGIGDSSTWAFTVLNDTEPPTVPANLRDTFKTSSLVTLEWDPSSDDYGPITYDVYGKKDGEYALAGSTQSTRFMVTKLGGAFLAPETTYTFMVHAVDGSGNESPQSNEVTVTTKKAPSLIWEEREVPQELDTNIYFSHTCYGAGKYVAVGNNGTILSSDDGISWEVECTGDILVPNLYSIAYGNDTFVAVGGNDFYTKTSTSNEWNKTELDSWTADLRNVACGKKRVGSGVVFVAVGLNCLWWSENGIDWQQCLSKPYMDTDWVLLDVAADEEGNFLAVGYRDRPFAESNTLLIWKSSDGKNWSMCKDTTINGQFSAIAYGYGAFMAGGGSTDIWVSTDGGEHWDQVSAGIGLTDIAYGDGLFVATGGNKIYFSDNLGQTWTLSHEFEGRTVHSVSYCHESFVAHDIGTWGDGKIYQAGQGGDPTLPSAPQNFTATPGDGQVALSWTAPASHGGSAITHYEVSSDGGDSWTGVGLTTSYIVTGLANGTEYTFKVRAVNSKGPGAAVSVKATPEAVSEFAGGSGTEQDPYLVETVTQLDNVRNHLDKHFKLTADLNLSVYGTDEGWEPIGTEINPFTGVFDGDGHIISNLFIDRITEPKIGLFGYAGETASIRDLGLANVNVTGNHDVGGLVGWNDGEIANSWVTGDVTGRGETGGLVGVNHGSIIDSWAEGTVTDVWGGSTGGLVAENFGTIANCHADATVTSGSSNAGGLVGANYGSITESYAKGDVEGSAYVGGLVGLNSEGNIDKSYAIGSVTGTEDWINYTFVGGLVGYNRGSISDSYARGAASGAEDIGGLVGCNADIGSITNCYSTGCVTGDSNIGGLVGYTHPDGIITSSYWDTSTSQLGHSAGGTGKTTTDMKQQETYVGWDFVVTWALDASENDGYPFLVLRTAPTVPIAPQNFTATPGDGQVELSWSAPASDGGSAITHYEVSSDDGENGENWTDVGLTTSHIVTGLTNGTEYTFKVRAVNSEGYGAEASVTATPVEAATVPTHTVNFYSNGSLYASKTVTSGSALGANWPDNPTRSGYSFGDWFSGKNGEGTRYTSSTIINADVDLYAKWTRISGGSSVDSKDGEDSAPSAPTTPTYQAKMKTGSGTEKVLAVTVGRDTGTVFIEEDPWHTRPQERTVINMPSIPGVGTYSVGTSVANLSTTDVQGTLTFNTGAGSITVPSNMLAGVAGTEGDKAQITIGQGDKSNLPDNVKDAIKDRPLIQLTLSIDGKQIDWNNSGVPVTVSIPYTPMAAELANPESIVVWYIDGSGNIVPIPNGQYDPETGTVIFTTTHFSYYAVSYNHRSFRDVADDAWYAKAVSFIAAREITAGTGGGYFSPEAKLTRGQFIVMLMRAYSIAPDSNPKDNFADAGNTYYSGYLAAAKRLGLSAGIGNNMFAPEKEITRQEMFTLLYNALKAIGRLPEGGDGKPLSAFADAKNIASWAKEAMTLLVKTGTISGDGGRLSPKSTTTRAEMAQVLSNLLAK